MPSHGSFAEANLLEGRDRDRECERRYAFTMLSLKRGASDDLPRLFSLVLDGSGQLVPSRAFSRMPTNARDGPEAADTCPS